MEERRPFCSEVSREADETLWATASRIDHWLLVEYRGVWAHDALDGSALGGAVREHLREQAAARPRTRVVFIRRPERRTRDRLLAYAATSRPGEERLARWELDGHDDLLAVDFASGGTPVRHPLFLACTHGKHDRCCALYGRPLFEALRDELDEEWLWQCSHIGGDRFAGNLACLPEGLFYGRLDGASALAVVDDHLGGRVHLAHYRGRSTQSMAVQAAERAVRQYARLTGIDDVAFGSIARRDGGWRVRLAGYAVDVDAEEGELTFLTCSSETLKRPRRFVARNVRPARS